jgi:hypothetical protein
MTLAAMTPRGARRAPTTEQLARIVVLDAAAFGIAAGVAIVAAAFGMPHGWWAAAFLGLVGCLSQLVLGLGHVVLRRRRGAGTPSAAAALAGVAGWNLACVAVPIGVFVGAPAVVALGAAVLLLALVAFIVAAPRSAHVAPADVLYALCALALAASAGIGTLLAFQ